MQSYHRISNAILFFLCALLLGCDARMGRSDVALSTGALRTPLTLQMLDRAAFTVWVDGRESAVPLPAPKNGADQVVWTQNSSVEWSGVEFGDSKTPGARYLRIGFTAPVPVGSVLVRGGGQLSVLKPGVPYPGHLNVPAEWISAQRLVMAADRSSGMGGSDLRVGATEVGREEYAVWVLPPGTQTRALRFAHTPNPIDRSYAGWLGGAYILADRLANMAPQAQATTRANPEKADLLNDSDNNRMWGAWDNLSRDHRDPTERAEPVSRSHPEDILLTWPRPITLNGLCALWAGFSAAEVQTYTGTGDPRKENQTSEIKSDANPESSWKTIRAYSDIQTQYPRALGVNWLDFGQSVTTRAIRFRVTQATVENHDHLRGSTLGGRRIWLGELLALRPLGNAPLTDAILPRPVAPTTHPPIPIAINLPTPGYVTLVIEKEDGRRVRNLLSATYFPKSGTQTVWWDGMDDLGRDTEASRHGIYATPGQFVAPGSYRVRGLVRPDIDLRYEFSPYNAGHPAWETADHTGGWTTNHTPPGCALFVPGRDAPGGQPLVFLGSYVSEGGDGLAWVDLDGHKRGGRGWIGGTWTGAQYLARDAAATTGGEPEIYAYVGAGWESDKSKDQGEIRLTGLTSHGDRPLLKYLFTPGGEIDPKATREHEWGNELGGLAVHKGLLVFSLTRQNRLVMVDVRTGTVRAELPLPAPRGLAFDAEGNLLVLSNGSLVRYSAEGIRGLATIQFTALKPETVISSGLGEPHGLALDQAGNYYISDWGESHQVKVFSPDGKPLRTIGHPGAPRTGRYDREHMNHPKGLTIDERNQLWVAEEDYQPKRVSVWSLEGKLLRDFYGPSQYGGGGTLDPKDKTRFYYTGMEFKLDWKQGTDRLINVFFRPDAPEMKEGQKDGPNGGQARAGAGNDAMPETPLYAHGNQYLTNAYNYSPTNGAPIAMLWQLREGVAHPVAAMGRANDWPVLKTEPFRSLWPQGVDLTGDYWRNQAFFLWCDRNGDGKVQPDEVTLRKAQAGGVTVMPNLTFVESRVEERTMAYAPVGFTPQGVPLYDLDRGRAVATGAQGPVSSGGDQALLTPDGWTILTNAPKPFSPYGIGGVKNGIPLWTYPSVWPGLHASHESAAPDRPGELVGTTRLLGGTVTPLKGDAGPLWAINGNMGNAYLFTSDGLFVAQLFQDVRQGQTWSMPVGTRGMNLNALTLHDENFWPSLTQTLPDGNIYCVDGARTSLVRLEGLESIRRLPSVTIRIGTTDLRKAADYVLATEAQRQKASGPHRLQVAIRSEPMTLPARWDGDLDAWKGADWVTVDKRGVAAFFNSDSRPYDVRAALMVAGDRLYAAYRTGDKDLLRNSGETPNALFKTGGALDLMLGTNPNADPKRQGATAGDVRLLVTRVNGKLRALLYRAILMPGAGTKEPVPFRSPSRGITFDRVDDVSDSDQVQLATDEKGDYIVSIPLSSLGWHPQSGQHLRGDIGLLRGNGFQTLQRIYWSNKATGITADVPSEAELTPQLWGEWEVR